MELEPVAMSEVVSVAEPEAFEGDGAQGVPSSRNVTVPVGEAPAATVATKVMVCP